MEVALSMSMIDWEKYPLVARQELPRGWLAFQANLGLAANTIQAYGRALDDYLSFCDGEGILFEEANREHIARYIRNLSERPLPANVPRSARSHGLSNATVRQRLTAVRLFYDYLVEDGYRRTNPVHKGRYAVNSPAEGKRGLVPTFHTLPWIPTDEEWQRILEVTKEEPVRNRFMFALAYDAGLRREELCLLATNDLDPARRLLTIRAGNTKNRRARTVPYSETSDALYREYLQRRREINHSRGRLFLSESPRNYGEPVSKWTWSKVVRGIAKKADVNQFSTHTLRHLCLTDLARSDWDIHQIALFAGHSSTQTTLRYIHLSGRELAEKLQGGMSQIHSWRINTLREML